MHKTEGKHSFAEVSRYSTLADFPIPAKTVIVPTPVYNVQVHGSIPLLQSEVTMVLPTSVYMVNPAKLKNELQGYDKEKLDFLVSGFTSGFR